MLNAKAFANATTTIMALFYVGCVLISYLAPDLIFNLARSWMHTVNMESIKTIFSPNVGSLIYGFVSATGLTWITTYITIILYNRWAR